MTNDDDEYKTTILEKEIVLFDGNGPETGRRIKCVYYVEQSEWDGEVDFDYYGDVFAECLGCGEMIRVDSVWGRSLEELQNDFGFQPTDDYVLKYRARMESYGFSSEKPSVKGDGKYNSKHDRKHCSDKCRKRIKRGYQPDRQPQPCQHCGSILATNNPKAKFCSAKCRVNASRSKKKVGQK